MTGAPILGGSSLGADRDQDDARGALAKLHDRRLHQLATDQLSPLEAASDAVTHAVSFVESQAGGPAGVFALGARLVLVDAKRPDSHARDDAQQVVESFVVLADRTGRGYEP